MPAASAGRALSYCAETVADEAGPSKATITVNTKSPTTFPPPKTDKPRPHICGTCTRSFARLEHLKRHERSHTKEKPFQCPECSRCFARRDLLLRHQQKLHQTTTPSSRPRNRRESIAGTTPGTTRARKNSVAGVNAANAANAAMAAATASMRPRANTISHIDPATMQNMINAQNAHNAHNAQVNRSMPATHSRHPSLMGLHSNLDIGYGMAAAMGQRGMAHGLPKLETHGINGMDFASNGLRTAPPLSLFSSEFDFDQNFFGPSTSSTINPNHLQISDSPLSLGGLDPGSLDPMSPYHGLGDMSGGRHYDDTSIDWLPTFEHNMTFNSAANENAVDGSSPSAISTTSQSAISDVMVDGSNHHGLPAASSGSMWQTGIMGPPHMSNPFSVDMSASMFSDILSGAPLSPQPPTTKGMMDPYFSTPPPSLSSLSPSLIPGMGGQHMNQALNYGAGPETPSSMNGSNYGTLPVSTITDSTRNAILGALSASLASQFGARRYSVATPTSPLTLQPPAPTSAPADRGATLPSTADLQRFVGAYLRYFHPHLPFVHIPTLSFETPPQTANGRSSGIGGSGCLLLSMAAIGALFELEHSVSMDLFGVAKKMIQLYLDERRKANVRKADFRRTPMADQNSHQQENPVETPVWLVQAMLLNVVYGHNCGDKTSGEIATTHAAALVSLAQGAELLRSIRFDSSLDVDMAEADHGWNGSARRDGSGEHAEWLRWKSMEERKRTLYAVFTLSSLLVSAYNHTPALTNSEILLDLPCDEEFFSAETGQIFQVRGGVRGANHNRITFHEALGELLRTNEKKQTQTLDRATAFDGSRGNLKPSAFGCLVLINALHNYIWETRQRHHNKVWTNEETEKMHRHIEPALRAWYAAWSRNPLHSAERPNPYGIGPLSADAIPLYELAHVRLFVNLSRSKERFWQRDWEGMAEELAKGSELIQHAENSPASNADSGPAYASDASGNNSLFVDSPPTQSSSPEFAASKFPPSGTVNPAMTQQQQQQTPLAQPQRALSAGGTTSRREKHLRKAAFYAAKILAQSSKMGVSFADLTSRELPLASCMCAFDCAQVLAEWVATLQDRVGCYLGILRQDEDFTQVPAIMLLEEDDVKLLGKVQEILREIQTKLGIEASAVGGASGLQESVDESAGFAARILRITACMFGKATVWPGMSRLISWVQCAVC